MPSYVARPHVLTDEFVPGYLGDSFGLFPFVPRLELHQRCRRAFRVGIIVFSRVSRVQVAGFPQFGDPPRLGARDGCPLAERAIAVVTPCRRAYCERRDVTIPIACARRTVPRRPSPISSGRVVCA
jgi:hypothetical protein